VGHLALVGPTAVGKTELAVELARRFGDLELVSVDAMAVYRELDIGTAKPTDSERRGVRWHLIDLVDPDEEFSVAQFQRAADETIAGIERRGHRALLVGGTGLYHRAVIDQLNLPGRFPEIAIELEAEADRGLAPLYQQLSELDAIAATRIAPGNRRRIVRALEVTLGTGVPFSSFGPGLTEYGTNRFRQLGLRLDRAVLDERIARRLHGQLGAGFLGEVAHLATRPGGLARTARQALGYRELLGHLAGEASFEAAVAETLARTRAFARRQERWFRRDPRVEWFDAERRDLVAAVIDAATRDT
jgi:tRNA dimethylallyltransferase